VLDVDVLVADLKDALGEATPVLAVRDVLDRALSDPSAVTDALPYTRAELAPLHLDDDLTVLKVVWAPGMWIQPHDHRMWAVIGIYGGQEDNTFYRRQDDGLAETGGKALRARDVAPLGDDTIHMVENPLRSCTAAIHVYGGHFFNRQRSDWDRDTLQLLDEPVDRLDLFEDWNRKTGL
jgi:predicted metal-dependent enzyme (double-stranded beta helix superfamily)